MDSSAVVIFGDLDELDSAIVINLSHRIGSQVFVAAVLALLIGFDHNAIAHIVCVWLAFSVFALIVLKDELLLTILNKLPIGFE